MKLNNAFHLEEIDLENSNYKREIVKTIINTYKNMFKDILNFTFEKTISKMFENKSDILLNENLVKESKISDTMNNVKRLFIGSDESFTELIDIDEEKEIKKEKESNNFLSYGNCDSYLESSNTIDDIINNKNYFCDRFKDIFNTLFEKCFLAIFNERSIYSLDSKTENEKIYFLKNKTKNNCHGKIKLFSINKVKKIENYNININITNETIKENNRNDKKFFPKQFQKVNDIENDKKKETFFIGKKRNIFRVKSDFFNIFNPRESNNYSNKMINKALIGNIALENKFVLTEFRNSINTKKRKKKVLKRKYNSDNIRKKVKTAFHRHLKDSINKRLNFAGSKQIFDYLPQIFITNITKNKNTINMDLTLEEIFSKNFCCGKDVKESTISKYWHNVSVLKYLEKNKEISKKSNFNIIKDMKYHEIYEEYLNSKEFEKEISRLKKKETDKYIRRYINKAKNLLDFFNY